MRVVGRDATPMRGRDGTDTSYETDTINIGPGESFDVIFTAPAHQGPGRTTPTCSTTGTTRVPTTWRLGVSEARPPRSVCTPGGVAAQAYPNDWGV